MTIQLPPEVEHLLIAKVHSGLFPSLEAAMTKAAYLLLEQIEELPATPKAKSAKAISSVKQPLTEDEFDQKLLTLGLLGSIPDTDADFDDPNDELVEIKGEPLSETVIRERR